MVFLIQHSKLLLQANSNVDLKALRPCNKVIPTLLQRPASKAIHPSRPSRGSHRCLAWAYPDQSLSTTTFMPPNLSPPGVSWCQDSPSLRTELSFKAATPHPTLNRKAASKSCSDQQADCGMDGQAGLNQQQPDFLGWLGACSVSWMPVAVGWTAWAWGSLLAMSTNTSLTLVLLLAEVSQ